MSADSKLNPPKKLEPGDNLEEFDSGNPVLDSWLKKRALPNESSGASRTYVVCTKKRVIAFYALAVGAVETTKAAGKIKRNMPDPIPVMVLGRLAVDQTYQKRGIGVALLRNAVLRTIQASELAGIRAILVHAIDESAKDFYLRHGFRASPVDPLTLMITIADAVKALK